MTWLAHARPNQITPPGDWRIWLIMAGRGWGKTRTGAEDVAHYALSNPEVRIGVIAPTAADARDVCVEGESGLLYVIPRSCIAAWHRSLGELVLTNGSRFKFYSADEPERLRGPQHHRVWCDELGAWPTRQAFDQLWFGLRLGRDPRVVITTTPRNRPVMRELVARVDAHITRGATFDNAANLASVVMEQLQARYGNTRLGRQELFAELLTDENQSLWHAKMLALCRVDAAPQMQRVVVAVDPALTSNAHSDETGVIAAGLGIDGFYYVLSDVSGRMPPDKWAHRASQLYTRYFAHQIVAEVNAGGDLVERLLRQIAPHAVVKSVRAVRDKIERALPIAALYEQGRVRHVGRFDLLEEQMMNFTRDGIAEKSPDRVDALVWALTALSDVPYAAPRVRTL